VIHNTSEFLINNVLSTPPPLIKICEYLGGLKYPAIRWHFSSTTHPLPKPNEEINLILQSNAQDGLIFLVISWLLHMLPRMPSSAMDRDG
jgi:hypothetical protein